MRLSLIQLIGLEGVFVLLQDFKLLGKQVEISHCIIRCINPEKELF